MDTVDIARWQFGITTLYHFLFVPLTIGMAFVVAGFQTAWHRTDDERYLKLTKFFGKLFLINFAMGVATGIVQEFQFGMNWSSYSRFVGDIFGAPLAMEGLVAFFLESTFLGLWIFGWDRLSRRVHLACIWIAAIGSFLSAYFILAANSFMQNPTGFHLNTERNRVELDSIVDVLTNKVAAVTFPHTIAAAFLTSGGLVLGVAMWRMIRHPDEDRGAFRAAAKVGAAVMIVAAVAVAITGDRQAKVMTDVQPMKMAAAEALYDTTPSAGFSIFTIGTLQSQDEVFSIRIPRLLSFLATDTFDGTVEGIDDIQAQYELEFGPGDYVPNIPVTFWSFRLMIGTGMLGAVIAAWMLWTMRKGRPVPGGKWYVRTAIVLPFLPLAGNSFGWIFTEMGRQPWIVFSQMFTTAGVSPSASAAEVVISLVGFTLLYGVLAVIDLGLMLKVIKGGLPDVTPPPVDPDADGSDSERQLAFAY